MKITTQARWESIDDFLAGKPPISENSFDYDGIIVLCKKGRNNLATAANQGNQNTSQAQGIANSATTLANGEVNSSGGLSPLVAKQLSNEQSMIGANYKNAAAAAQKGLTMRGMGAAPTGASSSITNTAINNANTAKTGAIGNAFATQNQLNNSAYAQPLNALQTANGGVNAATNAGTALNKAGSLGGDIFSGLSGLTGIGANLVGMGGLNNLGSNLMNGK